MKHHIKNKTIEKEDHEKNHKDKKADIEKIHDEKDHYTSKRGILKEYSITVDKAKVDVKIKKTEKGIIYELLIPEIDKGTSALLEVIRENLIALTDIAVGEISDEKSINKVKKKFIDEAGKLLKLKLPHIDQETEDFLISVLMQQMLGLGKIEYLIKDEDLEEIVIVSSKEPVRAYHKDYGWMITSIMLKSEDEISNYSNIIARRVGRQINVLSPLLDAHAVTGDRTNAVLYPISTKGNTITIRKFAREPYTMIDLIKNKTVDIEVACIIWLAMEYEMNVLISGGTASGKTVFLNSCMPFIPPNHRIITMEDTRELVLPEFLYWCPLVTRAPNPEGKGEVSMLDLLINALRMRPDRIVLGEIRRQKEAEVLFEAMHTGHSVYATVHANTAAETIRRLKNPPINIPPTMIEAVNLNVVMHRDRKKGLRRVYQVSEFTPGKQSVSANILYRWIPETDQVVKHNESITLFEQIERHTGKGKREIEQDLEDKKNMLKWMINNNIHKLNQMGKFLNYYYTDIIYLKELINKNNSKVFEEEEKSFKDQDER
jgi:flagellar protein FlaI